MMHLAVVKSTTDDSLYFSELEVDNYIADSQSIEVKEKQLYKDKATLVLVMTKFKVKHNFNFKVKRSDNKRFIHLVCY